MSVDPNEYDVGELRAIAGVEEEDSDGEREVDAPEEEATGTDTPDDDSEDETGEADEWMTVPDDGGDSPSSESADTPFTVDVGAGGKESDTNDKTEGSRGQASRGGDAPGVGWATSRATRGPDLGSSSADAERDPATGAPDPTASEMMGRGEREGALESTDGDDEGRPLSEKVAEALYVRGDDE